MPSPRIISDAEALDNILARYVLFGEQDIFDNWASAIEYVGDVLVQTGRQAWAEAGYLMDER